MKDPNDKLDDGAERVHRICFWHRNVQWAEDPAEIMKLATLEKLDEEYSEKISNRDNFSQGL